MAVKIGINGFGRIGRNVLRAAVQNFPDIEIVGINDLLEPDYLAYMLQYDSVHGHFKGKLAVENGALVVNGKKIRLSQERDPANLKWKEVGADVVIESTGLFLDKASAQKHLDAGARKVIISAPALSRNRPVDSMTTSAPTSPHFKFAGSRSCVRRMRLPLTMSVLLSTETSPLKRPCTLSYCSM